MPDYIKTSREITAALKAQGVFRTLEAYNVPVHAPVIVEIKAKDEEGEVHALFRVAQKGVALLDGLKIVAPFFGPGGADNCLKALRAWCKKNKHFLCVFNAADGVHYLWRVRCSVTHSCTEQGVGKTDGIALHNLLETLLEVKK